MLQNALPGLAGESYLESHGPGQLARIGPNTAPQYDEIRCARFYLFGNASPGYVHVIALPIDGEGIAGDVGVGREISVAADGADLVRGTVPYSVCSKSLVVLRLSLRGPLRSGREACVLTIVSEIAHRPAQPNSFARPS